LQYLFNEVYGGLKVHTEIYEDPLNSLFLVFLLLKYEHMVIEKLLQFLVRQIDTQLVKPIRLGRDATHRSVQMRNTRTSRHTHKRELALTVKPRLFIVTAVC
jgi:hypothetical protein